MLFEKARTYIYRTARPLCLALWKYHFENGSKEDVLQTSIMIFLMRFDGDMVEKKSPLVPTQLLQSQDLFLHMRIKTVRCIKKAARRQNVVTNK